MSIRALSVGRLKTLLFEHSVVSNIDSPVVGRSSADVTLRTKLVPFVIPISALSVGSVKNVNFPIFC